MSDDRRLKAESGHHGDSNSPTNIDDILDEELGSDLNNSDSKPVYQKRSSSVERKKKKPKPKYANQGENSSGRRSGQGRTSRNKHHRVDDYDHETEEFDESNGNFFNNNNANHDEEDEDDYDENYPLTAEQQQQHRHLHQQLSKVNQLQKQKLGNSKNSKSKPSNLKASPSVSMNTGNQSSMMDQQASGYEVEKKVQKFDIWAALLIFLSYFFLAVSFPFSLCACVKIAQEYERAVIFRIGRILPGGTKGPGIFFILPCIDTYIKVDLRTVTFDVPPQEILTRDSVTVSVDAVVYFRIFNATISVINVEDAAKSTKLLAASTLRNILGTKSLHEILSDRESVAVSIQSTLDDATGPWGVKVERVEVKDVRLPVQLQRAMATEAEAAREARAKVIAAEGEQNASNALRRAAEVITQSPIAIQLRYLQTLTQIASEKNSTIVFPVPLEMLSFLANKPSGGSVLSFKGQKKKEEAANINNEKILV